jgi:hypothetical protein
MFDEAAIRLRWDTVGSGRLFAAAEVRSAGRGGLAAVAKITGLARSTINRGEKDLVGRPLPKGRVRRGGGGRRELCENDPGLIPALKASRWRVYLSASVTHQSEPDHAHFEAHSDHRIRRNPQPSRLLPPSPCRRLARRRRTRPIRMSCAAWRLSPSSTRRTLAGQRWREITPAPARSSMVPPTSRPSCRLPCSSNRRCAMPSLPISMAPTWPMASKRVSFLEFVNHPHLMFSCNSS